MDMRFRAQSPRKPEALRVVGGNSCSLPLQRSRSVGALSLSLKGSRVLSLKPWAGSMGT